MTVKQLIEHLQTLDPELHVFRPGYEEGLDDVAPSDVIHVKLNYYTEWYYGQHERIDRIGIEVPDSVKGIVL